MSFLVLSNNKFFAYLETITSEKLGVYTSFFLHFLVLFFLIGLPDFFKSNPINVPIIIPIEIINITDSTSISKNISEKKTEPKKVAPLKEKKFNSSKNLEIKKITIKDKSEIADKIAEKNLISKNNVTIIMALVRMNNGY